MKKTIFTLGLMVALASCSSGPKEEAPKADSTVVAVDTTKLDSAAVVTGTVLVDTTKTTK